MQPDPAAESLRMLRAERDQLEAELATLARDVEDLKQFEAEYRERMIGYLDALAGTLRMEARL